MGSHNTWPLVPFSTMFSRFIHVVACVLHSLSLFFIHFCGWTFHCADLSRFACPSASRWTFVLFPPLAVRDNTVNVLVQVRGVHFPSSLIYAWWWIAVDSLLSGLQLLAHAVSFLKYPPWAPGTTSTFTWLIQTHFAVSAETHLLQKPGLASPGSARVPQGRAHGLVPLSLSLRHFDLLEDRDHISPIFDS